MRSLAIREVCQKPLRSALPRQTIALMIPRYCLLPDVGCIEVQGADARAFLHGQLSQEIASLEHERAPLAGWHDARGRLRALFRVLRLPNAWLLVTSKDMLDLALERLRVFVLRADVTLAATGQWDAAALIGDNDAWLANQGLPRTLPRDGVVQQGSVHWIRFGPDLLQALGPKHAIETFAQQIASAPAALATLAEIRLGIPTITPALIERYIPQMLNLDRLAAISFNKGCYPGQEVIARVRNLGSVKRRMRRYTAALQSAPPPGSEVFDRDGTDYRPVGELVRAAPAEVGIELLAVVEHEAAQRELFIGDERVPLLELPLPYDVPRS